MKVIMNRDPLSAVMWSFRREFFAVGVFSLVVNLLMLTPTLYMLQVFDRVMVSQSEMTLLVVSLITLFLFAMMAFGEWARSRLLVRTGVKLDEALSERVFRSSFLSYLQPQLADPAKAFGHLITLRQFLTGQGVFAVFDSPWVPIYTGVLFMLHPWLGIMATCFAIVQTLIAWYGNKVSRAPQLQAGRAVGRAQYFMQSKLRNFEVVAAMGMFEGLYRRWRDLNDQAMLQSGQAQQDSAVVMALSKFVRYAQQTFSLAIGAWLVIRGEISPGAMIAANVLTTRALAPIDLLVQSWPAFLSSREAYTRLRELLGFEPPGRSREMVQPPRGALSVRDVVAHAPGRERPVIAGISLDIEPGQVTVMMGPSGSGKSTLARVMLGIWPLTSGQVQLDGERIEQWTRESLGPHIGYLPQDIELFEGTIADNIARSGELDSGKVIEAAQAAGLHQMILRFAKGYDTPVGQAGGFLSGGQRQRIGLARALYGQPSLVILDEPNANLDDEGERALMMAVQTLKAAGKTVLLITHRPGAVRFADQLVLLKDGELMASGPRDAVLSALQKVNT